MFGEEHLIESPDPYLGKFIREYQIITKLGEGGMGVVYSAQHPISKARVAIKLLNQENSKDTDAVTRFFSEAKISSNLGHENIVVVFDVGYEEDTPYFIMEHLDGEPLSALL